MDRVNDLAQRGIAWQTRPGSEAGRQRPIHLTQAAEAHCGDAVRAKVVTTSGSAAGRSRTEPRLPASAGEAGSLWLARSSGEPSGRWYLPCAAFWRGSAGLPDGCALGEPFGPQR